MTTDIVCKTLFDYGNYLPSGITLLEAIKYQLSVKLKLKGVDDFETELEERYTDTVLESFTTALETLATKKKYKDLLFAMGNPVGKDTKVDSLYVQAIKNTRYRMVEVYGEQYDPDNIFNAYIAVSILTALLKGGKSDCSEYIGMNYYSIIDVYGRGKALSESISQDAVLELWKKGLVSKSVNDVLKYPYETANIVRKENIRSFKSTLEYIYKTTVLNVFLDHVIEQKFPDIDPQDAIKAAFSTISINEQANLMERVFDLHEMGLVASNVKINIPSEETVQEIESFVPNTVNPKQVITYDPIPFSNTILDFDYMLPDLYIDGLVFQSIKHYVYYKLTGKIYTKQEVPRIDNKYLLIPDISKMFNYAVSANEFHGIGVKILDQLYKSRNVKCSQKDPITLEIKNLLVHALDLYDDNKDIVGSKIPSALEWLDQRTSYMKEIIKMLGVRNITPDQRKSLTELLTGTCVTYKSDVSELENIRQSLYAMMISVISLHPSIRPYDVTQYSRKFVLYPREESTLPMQIRYPVTALKRIIELLKVIIPNSSTTSHVRTAIGIITGFKPLKPAERDDFSYIISSYLDIPVEDADIVVSFVKNIKLEDDDTQRRVLFYSSI
jgi:hypothetical protein